MGRSPCCDKVGLKKGPWTPEEDEKLLTYIEQHGHGSWRALPCKAGLERCGKSCRLRWTNYLRPDIKRGKFSLQEEQNIIQLHALLGNRWSAIATHLPKRTDNEIKNYWNTHLKKRLAKMGIDPITHKPKNDALLISSTNNDGTRSKNASNLSHMAQWESARLEAEARLVRESKLRNHSTIFQQHASTTTHFSPSSTNSPHNHHHHHHVFKSWKNDDSWSKLTTDHPGITSGLLNPSDLESPTSTLISTFSENNNNNNINAPPVNMGENTSIMPMLEFVGSSAESNNSENGIIKEDGWKNFGNSSTSLQDRDNYKHAIENYLSFTSGFHDMSISVEGTWPPDQSTNLKNSTTDHVMAEEGFTSLLINGSDDLSFSDGGTDSDSGGSDYYEDNKNYWNSILNLVNSSPSHSPIF